MKWMVTFLLFFPRNLLKTKRQKDTLPPFPHLPTKNSKKDFAVCH